MDECECARVVILVMPMAHLPLLRYEEVPKIGWTAKVSVVLYFGGSSLCRVNQVSVVHEYGVDAWRVGERRMKRIRKVEKMKRGERGKTTKFQIFPFCVHLAAIRESNDWPVSVDQSRRQIHHSRDGTILQ